MADLWAAARRVIETWVVNLLPGARRSTAGGLLAGLALSGWLGCSPRPSSAPPTPREKAVEQLTRAALASQPGASVLIIGNTFAMLRDRRPNPAILSAEAEGVRGVLRGAQGIASRLWIEYPELRESVLRQPPDAHSPAGIDAPLSDLTVPGAWDVIRSQHGTEQVWLSLVGFPADLTNTLAWTNRDGPRWAVFLADFRHLGTREAVRTAFQSERLLAAVVVRPGVTNSESASTIGDRAVLVTRDNLEQLLGTSPDLFPAAGPGR